MTKKPRPTGGGAPQVEPLPVSPVDAVAALRARTDASVVRATLAKELRKGKR